MFDTVAHQMLLTSVEKLCVSAEAPGNHSVPSPKVEPEESQAAVVPVSKLLISGS